MTDQADRDKAAEIIDSGLTLQRQIAQALFWERQDERERCALIAEKSTVVRPNWGTREAIAVAIRSRA